MKLNTLLIAALACTSGLAVAGEGTVPVNDPYVTIDEPSVKLQVGPQRKAAPETGKMSYVLKKGLLKASVEAMVDEFTDDANPTFIVWGVNQKIENYSDILITGNSFEQLLWTVMKQYELGACIRANNVIEIYDIKANRYYCED